MIAKTVGFLVLTICCAGAFAQNQSTNHLNVNTKKEGLLLFGGLLTTATGYYLSKQINPLSTAEIAALNRENIPWIDRFASKQNSGFAKDLSDLGLLGSAGFASLLLLNKHTRQDWQRVCVVGAETALWVVGVNSICKSLTLRTRPFVYNPNATYAKQTADARSSFFSMHTSLSAAACFYTAGILHRYMPNSKWRRILTAAAIGLPAATGAMRVLAGKHFPTDVLAGYLVGAGAGLLFPALHNSEKHKLSLSNTNSGFGFCYRI